MSEFNVLGAEYRIRAHVRETALVALQWSGSPPRTQAYLKLENTQETGAFKFRGAANKVLSLSPVQARLGLVTASNGNHALAVATMGRKLDIPTEVFVSDHIDPERIRRIEALGATVQAMAGDYVMAEQHARRVAERSDRVYVSPYNDAEVVSGQGTIAVELLRQLPRLDAVFVAVGGGGLIGGIGSHLKAVSPSTEVVGCWPENSRALYECLRVGRIVEVPELPTLSTSTAGGLEPGSITFALGQRVIDRKVLVSETEILLALRGLYHQHGQLVEGAAGVATAGFLKLAAEYAGKSVAIILCGGNVDFTLQQQIRAS